MAREALLVYTQSIKPDPRKQPGEACCSEGWDGTRW